MHTLFTAFKWLMIGVSCAGSFYVYWLLFFDEEWEWGWKTLLRDTLTTMLGLLLWLIWPFSLRFFRQPMNPVRFLLGGATVGGMLYGLIILTDMKT